MSDLVVVSLERWDDVWRRNQHLISALLAIDPELRVLFVEPAADPLHDARSGRRPEVGRRVSMVSERLWTFRALKPLPRRIDPSFDQRFLRSVIRAARSLSMDNPTLWINDPARADLMTATGWPTIYDITDDWIVADRDKAQNERTRRGEILLLNTADEVVACSEEILRRKQPSRPTERPPISLVPNAIDAAAFRRRHPRPHDLPAGRIALYLGTLHPDRLDVDLSIAAALAIRDTATLVFVGPDLLTGSERRRLAAAGAVVMGSRPHDHVVAYLQHADALVVPHLVSAFTESLDPIKLYEYRAAKRPIVSTPVAGFRDLTGPRVTIAQGADFIAAVRLSTIQPGDGPPQGEVDPDVPDWSGRAVEMAAIIARAWLR